MLLKICAICTMLCVKAANFGIFVMFPFANSATLEKGPEPKYALSSERFYLTAMGRGWRPEELDTSKYRQVGQTCYLFSLANCYLFDALLITFGPETTNNCWQRLLKKRRTIGSNHLGCNVFSSNHNSSWLQSTNVVCVTNSRGIGASLPCYLP